MGILSGLGGLVGGAMGLFGGGTNQPAAPPSYQFQNMPGADVGAFGGIQGLQPFTNLGQGALGPAQSTFANLYSNPYSNFFQGGAEQAGRLGQHAAMGAYGAGGALQQAGLGTLPWASQLFQSGFDPQQALYGRTAQQLTEQTRAGLEARGLNMTPYGAGVEGQTMSNFNIDWQNQQLMRQLQAAQGAGGLLSQGANVAGLGTGIQGGAPGQFLGASGMPFGAFGQIGGAQNQAISQLLGLGAQGQGLGQQQIADYLSYLQGGTAQQNANTALYQQQLKAQQQQFNEQMKLGGMLGQSLYGLGQAGFGFGGGGGGSSFFPSSTFMQGGFNTSF